MNSIKTLFTTENSKDKLSEVLKLSPEQRAAAWKNFLQYMKNYSLEIQSLFEENSLMEFIENNSDIDQVDIENFKNKTDVNGFWNESVQTAINYFYKYLDNSEENDNSVIQGAEWATKADIKNADAGRNFSKEEWVRPWKNINLNSYIQIRGNDKTLSVLKNPLNLQFTRMPKEVNYRKEDGTLETIDTSEWSINQWIRLIMPKNTRRVEIEDLNRNFWVIAQVLGVICGYLFDEDAPIPDMFKKLFDEVSQLWENILFLWAATAIESQKFCTEVRIEVIPLPISKVSLEKKYDNFDTGYIAANVVLERIKFLADKYNKTNLVILPIIKARNYKHNYYNKEYYPYIFFYHRGQETWTYITLGNTQKISFQPSEYLSKLAAAREEDYGYRYISAAKALSKISDEKGSKKFYSAIRIVPQIEATVDVDKINITKFELNGYDAVESLTGSNTKIVSFTAQDLNELNSSNHKKTVAISKTEYGSEKNTNTSYEDIKLDNGITKYYLGEIPSCWNNSLAN